MKSPSFFFPFLGFVCLFIFQSCAVQINLALAHHKHSNCKGLIHFQEYENLISISSIKLTEYQVKENIKNPFVDSYSAYNMKAKETKLVSILNSNNEVVLFTKNELPVLLNVKIDSTKIIKDENANSSKAIEGEKTGKKNTISKIIFIIGIIGILFSTLAFLSAINGGYYPLILANWALPFNVIAIILGSFGLGKKENKITNKKGKTIATFAFVFGVLGFLGVLFTRFWVFLFDDY